MSGRFKGKGALVTGGSSGIGATIARALADEGADVHVVASGSLAKAQAVTVAIVAAGGSATPLVVDIRDPAATRALVDGIVRDKGRLDLVVNAAGLFLPSPPGETEAEVIDAMIDTNPIGMPVSLRKPGEAGGNKFAGVRFAAPLAQPDPVTRMRVMAFGVVPSCFRASSRSRRAGATDQPPSTSVSPLPSSRA